MNFLSHRSTAEELLEEASVLNPGPWVDHSLNVARAARNIAEEMAKKSYDVDPEAFERKR
ncbi:MAG TPA: hypothetical protein VFK44_09240 [Bacillales bacterium]|nr:hypothetical protein [Bacillales bacterium]